ncbi:unnamed protein product, partial [marine sediment metagenome]
MKIAVIGEEDFVRGFEGIGFSVFPIEDSKRATEILKEISSKDFPIIYITETIAKEIEENIEEISKGEVQETPILIHKIMVPPRIKGEIIEIKKGKFTVEEPIAQIRSTVNGKRLTVCMLQRWPVRRPREYKEKFPTDSILVTGT